MEPKISVALATFNEEENLSRCLDSVKDWVDEIIIVDGGSSDRTVKIAERYGAKVIITDNPPIFHINKQKAIDACSGDWILQLDADEIVTSSLREEINNKKQITNNKKDVVAYYIPRKNYFLGRWLKKGGQYPDYVIRFFKKGKAYLPCKSVHEQMKVKGKTGYLKGHLLHFTAPTFSRYLKNAGRYTDLLADEIKDREKKNLLLDFINYMLIKPIHWFFLTFIRHKGFLDSWQGFVFSFFSALRFPVSYIKYLGVIVKNSKTPKIQNSKQVKIKKEKKEFKRKINQLINCLLVVVICKNFLTPIFLNKEKYTRSYWSVLPDYKKAYENSQYMQDLSVVKSWIPDKIVYSYAAGEYLKGANPIIIDPSQPPLGKYILAVSIALFNNENIAIPFFGMIVLLGVFLIAKEILLETTVSLLPLLFFSQELIFKSQFIYVPLLDIIQLGFLIFMLYFFILAFKRKKRSLFALVGLCCGAVIMTKFFITGLILFTSLFLYLLFSKKTKEMFLLIFSSIPMLLVIFLSYFQVILSGYNLKQILGIQKWIFLYHKSKLIFPFSIWPLIFLNRWHTWWGDRSVLKDAMWQITWPIVTIIAFLVIIFYFLKRLPRKKEIEPIIFWIIGYSLFISFGQANSRYLLPLLPFLYLVSFYGIKEILKKLQNSKTPMIKIN